MTTSQPQQSSPIIQSSPFLRLPPELQLHILTFTDLICPLRTITWDPQTGFALNRHMINTSAWRKPTSLFLVSRQFRQKAFETFFLKNVIGVQPDNHHKPGKRPRYAASEFLSRPCILESVQYLRSVNIVLELATGDIADQQARLQDWFSCIHNALRRNLKLQCMYIFRTIDMHEAFNWTTLESTSPETQLEMVRTFIYSNIWPLHTGQIPAGVIKEFCVELESDGGYHAVYKLRNVHAGSALGQPPVEDPGNPSARREISLRSMEDTNEDWIEELWIESSLMHEN